MPSYSSSTAGVAWRISKTSCRWAMTSKTRWRRMRNYWMSDPFRQEYSYNRSRIWRDRTSTTLNCRLGWKRRRGKNMSIEVVRVNCGSIWIRGQETPKANTRNCILPTLPSTANAQPPLSSFCSTSWHSSCPMSSAFSTSCTALASSSQQTSVFSARTISSSLLTTTNSITLWRA